MGTGFFGKLPASGDFVARGLLPGVQPMLDRWLTQLLLASDREFGNWPADGLRCLIENGRGPRLALLVVPSQDATGRLFPLAAVTLANDVGKPQIDLWAEQVLPILLDAAEGGLDATGLIAELSALPDLSGPAAADFAPPLIWTGLTPPEEPARFASRLAG